jgi:DNA-binding CsgD family transcriptional regulator
VLLRFSLSIAALCAGVFLAAYILYTGPRSRLNRSFALVVAAFLWWTFFIALANTEPDLRAAFRWMRFAVIGECVNGILMFRFAMILTGFEQRVKRLRLIYALLWITPLVMSVLSLTGNVFYAERYPFNFWHVFMNVYVLSHNIVNCLLFLFSGRRSRSHKHKKQMRLILVGGVATLAVVMASNFITAHFNMPPQSALLCNIWLASVFYAIRRYRLMAATPERMARDILGRIDEVCFLLDMEMRVIFVNEAGQALAGDAAGRPLPEFLERGGDARQLLGRVLDNTLPAVSTRFIMNTPSGDKVLLDANVSIIKDEFDDVIGLLVFARPLRGLSGLKDDYRLSGRELEVLRLVLTGDTYPAIAEVLRIGLRTVKAHVNNIYNKTGCASKMELAALAEKYLKRPN